MFTPGKKYAVTVRFTANDGRQLEETVGVGKSYTTVTATPTSVTAVVSEDLTAGAEVLIDDTAGVQVRLDGTAVTPGSVNFVPGTPSTFTISYSRRRRSSSPARAIPSRWPSPRLKGRLYRMR